MPPGTVWYPAAFEIVSKYQVVDGAMASSNSREDLYAPQYLRELSFRASRIDRQPERWSAEYCLSVLRQPPRAVQTFIFRRLRRTMKFMVEALLSFIFGRECGWYLPLLSFSRLSLQFAVWALISPKSLVDGQRRSSPANPVLTTKEHCCSPEALWTCQPRQGGCPRDCPHLDWSLLPPNLHIQESPADNAPS